MSSETIAQRYARLRTEVPPRVTIVAVSKGQTAEAIGEAIGAGVTDIGENYVQEAHRKFAALGAQRAEVTAHFLGHVQTNKAKLIAATFDTVQSVDRIEAGDALAKAASALGKRLPILLQINISPVERFGASPSEAAELARRLSSYQTLRLDGVMAIGPITDDRALLVRAFAEAVQVWKRVGGPVLSLGMSGDWRDAVAAGSTMIRLGTAIFGPRPVRATSKTPR